MAGITAMGDLSHELETLVIQIDNGSVPADDHAHAVMQASLDELARMRDMVSAGQLPAKAAGLIAQIRVLSGAPSPFSPKRRNRSSERLRQLRRPLRRTCRAGDAAEADHAATPWHRCASEQRRGCRTGGGCNVEHWSPSVDEALESGVTHAEVALAEAARCRGTRDTIRIRPRGRARSATSSGAGIRQLAEADGRWRIGAGACPPVQEPEPAANEASAAGLEVTTCARAAGPRGRARRAGGDGARRCRSARHHAEQRRRSEHFPLAPRSAGQFDRLQPGGAGAHGDAPQGAAARLGNRDRSAGAEPPSGRGSAARRFRSAGTRPLFRPAAVLARAGRRPRATSPASRACWRR